jgi:hypothetical protein
MTVLAAFALLLLAGCQSIRESSAESRFMPQINPYYKGAKQTLRSVKLYYPITGEPYLSSLTTTIEVHEEADDTLQDALMRELASNPPIGSTLESVFTDGLRRISLQAQNRALTVTLSREMLALGEGRTFDSAQKRKLALYAIVNTLTGNGEFNTVQILIDMDNNGHGRAPTRLEVGLTGEAENEPLGPLGFSNLLLWTPDAAVQAVLNAAADKDAKRINRHLSASTLNPDVLTLETRLRQSSVLIVDHFVTTVNVSADGQQATVYVDFTIESADRSLKQLFNYPIQLRRERDVWKVEYAGVESLLFNQE